MSFQKRAGFEWDPKKDSTNQEKHGVSFFKAQFAFADPNRVILEDITHSTKSERRYFCLGIVDEGILTVRFTVRNQNIRIFRAGYWRKGKRLYEQENKI